MLVRLSVTHSGLRRVLAAQLGACDSSLLKDDLEFAVHTIRCEYEINRPPELVRDQIAYQAGAIAG